MQKNERLLEELRGLLPEYMAQKRILIGGRKNRLIRCINPQHEDRHPSMSYYQQAHKLKCFSCGASYDIFDVIAMDYPDCDSFPRQVKKACDIFGLPFPEDFGRGDRAVLSARAPAAIRKTLPAATLPAPQESVPQADYTALIEEKIKTHGLGGEYFEKRGISRRLCEKYRLFQADGRAWMPVFEDGKCICYCARAISDTLQPRYKNSPGPMEIFGARYFHGEGEGGALFITESILDALSAEECGYQAVALCGAANVRKFLELCRANPAAANRYKLIAAGDADEAGRRMNAELAKGLRAQELSCGEIQLPAQVKDFNELLMRDREVLRMVLGLSADADRRAYEKTSAAAAVGELLDEAIRRASRDACPTGFPALDRVLDGGLYAGLYIIGAISSLGKTSFVLQIADYIAAHGTDVLYFSLEMSRMELMSKSISRLTYQNDPAAEHADAFTARQVMRLRQDITPERGILLSNSIEQYKYEARRLFLREGIGDISAADIRAAVGEHIRLRGCKPVVVVDYLQILKPADPRATDKQNTDRSVVELKRISRDFDLPVLAISSFNRENYRNAVSMEAFKESGAVEYSSDVLLGLQLSGAGEPGFDVNAAKARSPRAVELVLLKNRNGVPYARIEYAYIARFGYFGEGAVR
ncbi:DnaB-like helicase C-terminal domain-containing protein [Anaerotruncus rubiinfantis]|uniref:DnaB-like helicase C-terminal domain-containing protein n=1 Tax=Anaerotruncus rubiinfantis TaxID=1720200 RepID=UPI00189BE4A9|nr:DnaB-like helicase C-terminal domain-containing protein [Anaerotruncus rubiinfantis]